MGHSTAIAMKLARSSLMLVAMIGAASLARAHEDVQHAGEVTYTIPPGWEQTEKQRIVVLTPKGSSPEQASLVVTPGETLAAGRNFPEWFKDKWEGLRKEWKVVQGGERTGQEGPLGSSVLYQAAMLEAVVNGKPTARAYSSTPSTSATPSIGWCSGHRGRSRLTSTRRR